MAKKIIIGFILLALLSSCLQSEEDVGNAALDTLQQDVIQTYPDDEDDMDEDQEYPELSEIVQTAIPTTESALSSAEYTVQSVEGAKVVIGVEFPDLDGYIRNTCTEEWLKASGNRYWSADDVLEDLLDDDIELTRTETYTVQGTKKLFGISGFEVISGDVSLLRTYGLSDDTQAFVQGVIDSTEADLAAKETEELSAKYSEILATEPTVMSIDEIIQLYQDNTLGYHTLNDKHIRVTGYFKSSGTLRDPLGNDVPTVSLDNATMDSWFGSQMKFAPGTDVSLFASMVEGDILTVEGIGDTEGATFSMHHCTLVDSKASGTAGASVSQINTYVPLDAEDASRNPDSWDGMLVEYTGTIQQVMKPSLFSWHTRYIVGTGANRICFYTNTSKNYMAGDTVTVRGEFSGIMQAENIFNNTSHLPDIEAHEVILH